MTENRPLRPLGAETEPSGDGAPATALPGGGTNLPALANALRVRTRYDRAEPALRNAALTSPDALAFLEASLALIAETAEATRARALLTDEAEAPLLTVAVWAAEGREPPEPDTLEVSDWPAVGAGRVVRAGADARWPALRAAWGCTDAVLAPFQDEHGLAGLFLLERDGEELWDDAEVHALGGLARLFETLWAWNRAEARYRQTVADLEDGLFDFAFGGSRRRRYTLVTPQVERITGWPTDQMLEGALDWMTDVVHPEDADAFATHDAALWSGDPSQLVYRIRRPDGEVRWVRESATPSRSASGRPVAGGLLSDVTEAKRAEATLLQAKLAAERASHAKTAFLATMSHEIRSPLGAIRGFAELLAEEVRDLNDRGGDVPPQIGEFAGIIAENTQQALRLVHNLFDLSRLETGSLALRSLPVELHPVIERVVEQHRAAADAKGLALHVERAEGEPLLLADPERLEQVVDQLVSNAVKFTEAGSITISTLIDEGSVRLAVKDTGVGIAAEYLERLFEPFSQEDYRLNRSFGGSGLGLAIVKRLLDGMGATIRVESEKGGGSRFEVTFPVRGNE